MTGEIIKVTFLVGFKTTGFALGGHYPSMIVLALFYNCENAVQCSAYSNNIVKKNVFKLLNKLQYIHVLQVHPSIVQAGSRFEIQASDLNQTLFHCLLCPKFKLTTSRRIQRHMEAHINNALHVQGNWIVLLKTLHIFSFIV